MMPYKLIYKKRITISIDGQRNMIYMEKMIDIMEGVSQLRTNTK